MQLQPLCCPSHPRFLHNLMRLQNLSLYLGCSSRSFLGGIPDSSIEFDVGFVLDTYSVSFADLPPTWMSSSQKNHTNHRVGVLCYSDISVVAIVNIGHPQENHLVTQLLKPSHPTDVYSL